MSRPTLTVVGGADEADGAAVAFNVHGMPVPQGSMTWHPAGGRRGARPVLHSTNSTKLAVWRGLVQAAAIRERNRLRRPLTGPLGCELRFRVPMPITRRAADRHHGAKWATSRVHGDIDKLARAVLDALTDSGLIADDSQIVQLTASKTEQWTEWTGVELDVYELRVLP